jgi:cytidine deaminase
MKKWKKAMLSHDERQELARKALEARKNAYAPYSKYPVGAALLTETGQIYTGSNVENAVYNAGMCAERVAVFNAVHSGEQNFRAIAVATENGGTPCGSCRQVLAEFGLATLVLVIDKQGNILQEIALAELLPQAFTAADLNAEP